MEPDLTEIWNKLTLTEDEENGVNIASEDFYMLQAWIPNCLVGKLLTKKTFSRLGLRSMMERAWKEMGLLKIEELGENLFLFQFRKSADREVAMVNGPWNYDNQLLLLKHMQKDESPGKIDFKTAQLWIQIYDLPIHAMTHKIGESIGGKVGRVLEVKTDGDGVGIGSCLKVRVEIEVDKPLVRRVKLNIDEGKGETKWVYLRYERLPYYCAVCGRLGHQDRECHQANQQRKEKGKIDIQYGNWLRAPHRSNKSVSFKDHLTTHSHPPLSQPSILTKANHPPPESARLSPESKKHGDKGTSEISPPRVSEPRHSCEPPTTKGGEFKFKPGALANPDSYNKKL